jgi:predicted metal-dependent HD superfamily phosphohydrolase
LCRHFGIQNPAILFAQIVDAYSQSHRAYHNCQHIIYCLQILDRVRDLGDYIEEVEMALWFHDAIYEPQAADNEELSAAWAKSIFEDSDTPLAIADRVAELILATKHQVKPSTPDAHILVDIDLAILGAKPEIFDTYDRQIRQEYIWVEEESYRAGRMQVLRGFLERDFIFHTPYFRQRYEQTARVNLDRAIARLKLMGS